jgi:hypothetical protein
MKKILENLKAKPLGSSLNSLTSKEKEEDKVEEVRRFHGVSVGY